MINLGLASDSEVSRHGAKTQRVEGSADLARRSLLAFLKTNKDAAEAPTSVFIEYASKEYVALVTRAGIAAIYRIRNDLQLKRMRRIPEPVAYRAEGFRREQYQGG
jgi:hypothetical protein